MDSVFLVSHLAACSLFRLQLQIPFECINFFKKEQKGQREQAFLLFCCLNLAIPLQSVILWLFL
jgi:hypothetical protein